jgi:serine/threonine protein phosphatase PrpC
MTSPSTETSSFDLSLLRCAAGTDVGMRREENQDSFGVIKRSGFQAFFVADGMGGAQGGATASRMAISTLQEALGADDVRISVAFIANAIQSTNQRIFEKGSTDPAYAGMGTTLVGLVFTSEGAISVNVGDSRAYRVRHQNIEQISKDHTLVSELIESGTIAAQDAQGHPVSHMLTRSLGPVPEVEVECHLLPELPENGDIYILCSDGLYNYVPAQEMLAVVRQNALDDANQILINLANQRGGGDNITVLVIAVGEKSPRGRKPTLPYPLIDIEDPSAREQLPAQSPSGHTEQVAPIPVPPPVEEPKDRKSQHRALRERARTYAGTPRVLPTVLLLGSTLAIGLVLGGLVRKVSLNGVNLLTDIPIPEDAPQKQQASNARIINNGDANPLADLARQIRAERDAGQDDTASQDQSQLARRPEQVQAAIRRLEAQIQALDTMVGASNLVGIDQVKAEVERLQREYSAIESSLDVASRAVTLWLSRQVAFESQSKVSDSLSEVEQVAAYSSAIKDKLNSLTTISYQLRGKADEVELYPSNGALRADLEVLQAKRDQLRRELTSDVRRSLGTILAKAYKDYEAIRIRRDLLWLDLQGAKRELEVQSIIADGDPTRRAQLIRALNEQLDNEKRLLSNLSSDVRNPK